MCIADVQIDGATDHRQWSRPAPSVVHVSPPAACYPKIRNNQNIAPPIPFCDSANAQEQNTWLVDHIAHRLTSNSFTEIQKRSDSEPCSAPHPVYVPRGVWQLMKPAACRSTTLDRSTTFDDSSIIAAACASASESKLKSKNVNVRSSNRDAAIRSAAP